MHNAPTAEVAVLALLNAAMGLAAAALAFLIGAGFRIRIRRRDFRHN